MTNLKLRVLRDFYKITPMREGILTWYPFAENSSVLERTNGALTPLLRKCKNVVSFNGEYSGNEKYDYVVCLDPGEITVCLLEKYNSYLTPHGRLLLAFENPYGLQYFAGKRNPRTNSPFTFWYGESKEEVKSRLLQAGFTGQKWYYPFTNHYFTREVYSENYLPNAFLNHRGYEYIEDDYTKEFDERGLWKEVIRGGAFEFLCNSYLVEARVNTDDTPCYVDFAAITAYRERDKAFITTVNNDGTARKTAVFSEGAERLKAIVNNHNDLIRLGVNALPLEFSGNSLTMKRIDLPTIWDYWTGKLIKGELSENELFSHFDRIRDSIYASAKDGKCYWELVPANCFYDSDNEELLFFDQEYYWENIDPDMVLVRAIHALKYSIEFQRDYRTGTWLSELKQRYGLAEKWESLVDIADKKTREFVFNPTNTNPLERAVERVTNRLDERAAEYAKYAKEHEAKRTLEHAAQRARYQKMCVAAVALKAMNISRTAIYGYGVRGKMLRYVLESVDMDICCIIDKQMPIVRGVPLFATIDDAVNNTYPDILVVTPVKDAGEIAAELRIKVRCPVVTIEELVNG